jgi:predicted nucleotidyltransferase/DNA-binding HxlR family transcriptional regulator
MERIAATLFGRTRRAVLARLFLEPQREYRLRELARLAGISAGSVQQELKQLVAADLALRRESGTQVTYRANTASPVFGELRALVEKTSGIEQLLRRALEPAARRIRLALIYGSIARGTNRATSDLDLLVVGTLGFEELLRLLGPAEKKIGREVSPRLYSEQEFRDRRKRGDRFLTAVLRGPRVMLLGELDDAG